MVGTHHIARFESVLLVGIGGFAGSNLRYFIELSIPSTLIATLSANVLGCLALGFLLYENLYGDTITQSSRTVLGTGFIASFTTYSTFILDAITADPILGAGYVLVSYGSGFAAVLLGRKAAQEIVYADPKATGVDS